MQGVPFSILYRYHHFNFNDVQIDFQMEVTAAESSKETNNSVATTSSSSSFKFGCFAKGSVTVKWKGFFIIREHPFNQLYCQVSDSCINKLEIL